jgi:hypothetical protein
MKKLVCDRCGAELKGRYDVELALEGRLAWQTAVKAEGAEPRGVFPCQNFIRCGGEMVLIKRQRRRLSGR